MKQMNFSTRSFAVIFLVAALVLVLAAVSSFAAKEQEESGEEQTQQSAQDSGPDESYVLPSEPSVTSHEITFFRPGWQTESGHVLRGL